MRHQRVRTSLLIIALAAMIGILLAPPAAWAAKTVRATNSAACDKNQVTTGVTYYMTNVFPNPPSITVHLVDTNVTIAPGTQVGNRQYYSADITSPVDYDQPAAAMVPNGWSGKFVFDSVKCRHLRSPSMTIRADESVVTVRVTNNDIVTTNFTVRVANASQQLTIPGQSALSVEFNVREGAYTVLLEWLSGSATSSVAVGGAATAPPTVAPRRSPSEEPSASATPSAAASSVTTTTESEPTFEPINTNDERAAKNNGSMSFSSIVYMTIGILMFVGPIVFFVFMWRRHRQVDAD